MQQAHKGTKKLDANVSKALEMPEGTKIGHAMDVDSSKHKEAVKFLKEGDQHGADDNAKQLTGEVPSTPEHTSAE